MVLLLTPFSMRRGVRYFASYLPSQHKPPLQWCFSCDGSQEEIFNESPPKASDNMFVYVGDPPCEDTFFPEKKFWNMAADGHFRRILGWEDFDELRWGTPMFLYWAPPGRSALQAGFYKAIKLFFFQRHGSQKQLFPF